MTDRDTATSCLNIVQPAAAGEDDRPGACPSEVALNMASPAVAGETTHEAVFKHGRSCSGDLRSAATPGELL